LVVDGYGAEKDGREVGLMDIEMNDDLDVEVELEGASMAEDALMATVERLAAATAMLEQAVERMFGRQGELAVSAGASVGRIVATVESKRETELEQKLAAAEAEIAELRAAGASAPAAVTHSQGRKTLPVSMVNLLAKQGVTVDSMEAGALDAALVSLSIEQRIAVKAQLMRAGLLG
jgi:hypothetical protein